MAKTNAEWTLIAEKIKAGSSLPPWFVESLLIEAVEQLTAKPVFVVEPGFNQIAGSVLTERRTVATEYPFALMEINDSFFVEADDRPDRMLKRLRRLALRQLKRKHHRIACTVHAGKKLLNGEMRPGFYVVRRG